MYGGKFAFQNRLSWLVVGRKFTIFALFCFVFEGKFQVQAPWRVHIQRGDLTGGFFGLRFWGAYILQILEGLIFGILWYFWYKQEHGLLQMSGPANGVCYYLALQKIYCMLILWICTFSPPEL